MKGIPGPVALKSEMARVKSKVDSLILEEVLPSKSGVPEISLLYDMMRDYPRRPAKGLRPFLCVTACEAMGGTEQSALLTAACIEMFQHWILIHDDIEDGSELRRGEPALHRIHGVPLALNAGDALHARMWGALLSNQAILGWEKTLKIMHEFSRMVNETTEGQHMELSWVRDRRWDLDESDYFEMCARKTSWYTIASPSRLGALVAGAGEGELEKLLEFGLKLGVGFQIQDDALNLVGDQKKYGKASSDDLLEGKRTVMLLRLLHESPPAERARLISIMNKPRARKTAADIQYVLSRMKRQGVIEYAQRKARSLVDESLAIIDAISWKGDKAAVDRLRSVARFAVERQW